MYDLKLIMQFVLLLQGLKQSEVNTSCSQTKIHGAIQHRLQGTGIPCKGCVTHTAYLAHGNSKNEGRGRSRHRNNSKREIWKKGTWARRGKVSNEA